MHYRKNIFKDKTFVAMSLVSLITAGLIVGCSCAGTKPTEEETSISDINESSDSKENSSSKNDSEMGSDLKEDVSKMGRDLKENASELGSDIGEGASELGSDIGEGASELSSDMGEGASELGSDMGEQISNMGDDMRNGVSDTLSAVDGPVSSFSFSSNETLIWPVDTTDVVLEYSPDSTIYFATLDKYKTNDAVCIRSEVGTPVYASADGTVTNIGYNEEIGNFVSLNLGSDYLLTYGQIKDIQLSEGDTVKAGDLVCYVATPTKYYSVEGANLYLKLSVDGSTVDPLDYLDFEE